MRTDDFDELLRRIQAPEQPCSSHNLTTNEVRDAFGAAYRRTCRCPTDEALAVYAEGGRSFLQQASTWFHLLRCPLCRSEVQSLQHVLADPAFRAARPAEQRSKESALPSRSFASPQVFATVASVLSLLITTNWYSSRISYQAGRDDGLQVGQAHGILEAQRDRHGSSQAIETGASRGDEEEDPQTKFQKKIRMFVQGYNPDPKNPEEIRQSIALFRVLRSMPGVYRDPDKELRHLDSLLRQSTHPGQASRSPQQNRP